MKKYILSERNNLFEPNVYISLIVKLCGEIPADSLVNAVQSAYKANEATMSKIVLEESGDAYYELMENSGCKVHIDNRQPFDIIRASEKEPFDLKNGELIRTFIIPDSNGVTLLIHAHHLVGDGKSIVLFLSDILNSLAEKKIEYKPLQIIDTNYLEKRVKLTPYVRLFVNSINRKWQKVGKPFTWDDYLALHTKYWTTHSSDFEVKTYSLCEQKKRCSNGTTINSLLITDMFREHGGQTIVGIPVSIRENSNSMSNQTSGISVKCRYNSKKTFDQNLATVHKSIYRKLNDTNRRYFVLLFLASLCPTLIDAVLMQSHGCYNSALTVKFAEIMGYGKRKTSDIGVTNLGKIDIPHDYDIFQVTDILFIPPKISYSKDIYGVSSFADKLTICRHVEKN